MIHKNDSIALPPITGRHQQRKRITLKHLEKNKIILPPA